MAKKTVVKATTITDSTIKAPGGKSYVVELIRKYAPPHTTFVDLFTFSARVLFGTTVQGKPGRGEIINDLDKQVANFWRVLQLPESFKTFQARALMTPFSQPDFEGADLVDLKDIDVIKNPRVDAALTFFVRTRMSYCGIGESFAILTKNRTRTAINEQASALLGAVSKLPEIHARLLPVLILNEDFGKVMKRFDGKKKDGENVFIYADPTYIGEKEGDVESGLYRHTMTEADHLRFLQLADASSCKIMISGYDNPLYRQHLKPPKWRKVSVTKVSAMTKSDAKPDRVEVLWMNYEK